MNPQPKQKQWRSKEYLEWLRNQPPLIQGTGETVSHHIKLFGNGGTGIKPPDDDSIPISDSIHQRIHSSGRRGGERNVLLQEHGYTIESLRDLCDAYRLVWERTLKKAPERGHR
jgi:hypothetical protein